MPANRPLSAPHRAVVAAASRALYKVVFDARRDLRVPRGLVPDCPGEATVAALKPSCGVSPAHDLLGL